MTQAKLDFSDADDVTDAHMRVDMLYELTPSLTDLTLHTGWYPRPEEEPVFRGLKK
ncbi:hypothetical protein AURDEDRAFT_164536 [Auricularia subglabra TFB-10046 SS5]|nr:hypothetical protein AURDEDRAFT_164536 [Auricularia subglabra TFB-10046 SS5]